MSKPGWSGTLAGKGLVRRQGGGVRRKDEVSEVGELCDMKPDSAVRKGA